MLCHVIMTVCHFCQVLSAQKCPKLWQKRDSIWQKWHSDMMTWHDIKNNVGATSRIARRRFLKKKWVENLLFWWSNHIITICHNLSQFVTFWSDSMWQKWHTDMTTWHDITNKVTHTSTRTIHRFLKKNGVKTLKIEGVRAILVTWCLKKPNFLNNCRR